MSELKTNEDFNSVLPSAPRTFSAEEVRAALEEFAGLMGLLRSLDESQRAKHSFARVMSKLEAGLFKKG